MPERYHRSQLLLEPEQYEQLREIAREQGRSISQVARDLIDLGLEALRRDREARARRQQAALRRLRAIREAAAARCGIYEGDLLAEARAEREASDERVRKGEA